MARFVVTFTGNNGSGAISIPNLELGDRILSVVETSNGNLEPVGLDQSSPPAFVDFVFVTGQLFQIATGNFSTLTFSALVERHVIC